VGNLLNSFKLKYPKARAPFYPSIPRMMGKLLDTGLSRFHLVVFTVNFLALLECGLGESIEGVSVLEEQKVNATNFRQESGATIAEDLFYVSFILLASALVLFFLCFCCCCCCSEQPLFITLLEFFVVDAAARSLLRPEVHVVETYQTI